MEELKGKGVKKGAQCQHVLQQLLCYGSGFAFCRGDITGAEISQESASLASVFVLSKSAMIYLQKHVHRQARTGAQGCTPSFTDVETGEI